MPAASALLRRPKHGRHSSYALPDAMPTASAREVHAVPELPPASWQPDPENPNQLRWWDGLRWAAATTSLAQHPAVPAPAWPVVQSAQTTRKPARKGWRMVAFILGALIVGGILARVSSVAITLALLAILAVAIFAFAGRPLRFFGMRTRRSGFAGLGIAALILTGGGIATAGTSAVDAPMASTPQLFADTS